MRTRKEQNLRKNVEAESWASKHLAKTGKKFTRQAIWGCRLFDFWCAELGIAVEIDGLTHDKNYDRIRDKYNFYRSGIIVLRVKNFDEEQMKIVLRKVQESDNWAVRKVKMREEFGLKAEDSFSKIIKIIGLNKAHGDWNPSI
jgi:very-short-patch-repair endonuclease